MASFRVAGSGGRAHCVQTDQPGIPRYRDARAGALYSAISDQGFLGVATFTESFGLTNQFQLAELTGPIIGLVAGDWGEFYVASENGIRRYDAAASLLQTISTSATTTIPALSYLADTGIPPNAAPSPGTLLLLLAGAGGLVSTLRRRSQPAALQ